jgi:hypothetical protein
MHCCQPILKHAQEEETYLQVLLRIESEQNIENGYGKDGSHSILRLLTRCRALRQALDMIALGPCLFLHLSRNKNYSACFNIDMYFGIGTLNTTETVPTL